MRGTKLGLVLLLLVLWYGLSTAEEALGREVVEEEEENGYRGGRGYRGRRGGGGGEGGDGDYFLLGERESVFQTEAGELTVVRSFGGRIVEKPMHIGLITMEPKTLYIPQYLDSGLIIFVHRGDAKLGLIYEDDLVERRLKIGDIYHIPPGSAFYLVNIGEGQRLHIICSIDTSESLGLRNFQSFFIGGGDHPASVLRGLDLKTLATAFNVTVEEMSEFLSVRQDGPFMFIPHADVPTVWSKFLELKEEDKLQYLKEIVESHGGTQEKEKKEEDKKQGKWSWRDWFKSIFKDDRRDDKGDGDEPRPRDPRGDRPAGPRRDNPIGGRPGDRKGGWEWRTGKGPDPYNLHDRQPDFRNNYGWSMAIHGNDYEPLQHSGIGVYLVNLTAGSMMAPHVNPTATEYGVVLKGRGTIQIGYPNGTSAMNRKVREGDVFWVPRYFPFCQIASRTGPFEFFGFTTSARQNRPQFLAGRSSVLRTLRGPELAIAYGFRNESDTAEFLDAQREWVILPMPSAAPPEAVMGKKPERGNGARIRETGEIFRE